ncbi:abortive phage infection protein [Veillonella sp.]|uniref:type IV toxin-antitoxin system AbiEi family antitoxin domain-containing protein n=1 Tax=Veillonella sp. TaxID=1926307 RepID=UPI0025FBFAC7|nr:abortive phage infection protein [Veillonella sp.]
MSQSKVLKLAYKNNGTITSAMITEEKISRGRPFTLFSKNRKTRTYSPCVYILPEVWDDEFLNAQTRYKKSVFSLGSALFLLGLTDRTPAILTLTFPSSYNVTAPRNQGYRCNRVKNAEFNLGIITTTTPAGNLVKTYNAERTLCDIVKPSNRVDIQLITAAFKQYMASYKRNLPLLSEYAKILKVEKKIKPYIEVLQ